MIRASVALLTLWFLAIQAPAFAANELRTFNAPAVNGVRLDFCKHWGSQCGAPAADLFCRERGYQRSARFAIHANLGATGVPTLVFGDGRLCQGSNCSGFAAITCVKPGPVEGPKIQSVGPVQKKKPVTGTNVRPVPRPTVPAMTVVAIDANTARFNNPSIKHIRLGWCRNTGTGCGQPAAELFCAEKGFTRAIDFRPDLANVGANAKTLIFGDGKTCTGRTCRAFAHIVCTRNPPQVIEAETPPPEVPSQDITDQDITAVVESQSGPALYAGRPVPLPITRPELAITPVAVDEDDAVITFNPAISFAEFKPPTQLVLMKNWATVLRVVASYPEGASLYKCASGDCSLATSANFEVDPDAEYQSVILNYNVSKVPHASGARWQVGYLPFPPFADGSDTDIDPPGLLATGLVEVQTGGFAFDLNDLATDLPPGATAAIFHARVLPVATAGAERIVGQPSNVMQIFYGAKLPPPPPFTFYDKQEIPGSKPELLLAGLKFEPIRTVERWPTGCKTWEEKYGKKKSVIEKVGKFLSGAWDWTSKAYQWAKTRVIDLAGALTLNLIPDEVLSFALDSALVSVGIPPDIPNLEALMKDGVDGLAREVAKSAVQQIPTADLAANVGNLAADIAIDVAAGIAEDELRERLEWEIEKRSRQAILTAASEMEKQLTADGKKALCKTTTFHGVFHVTVRNPTNNHYDNVEISASAPPVYHGADWVIDIGPGETLKLVAVGSPMLPGGPYSHPLLRAKEREEEDMGRWWNEIVYKKPAGINVTLPGVLKCLGGDPRSRFCDKETVTAHRSPPQLVTRQYVYNP